MPPEFVIGFDLDMTLVDSRARIRRHLGGEPATSRLVTPDRVDELAPLYRSMYADHAMTPSSALAGAREAVRAVQVAGGRVMVVTAKSTADAERHLVHLGLEVDEVCGLPFAAAKGKALREHRAEVYVGDHVHDIVGARAAKAVAVAVATGPCSAVELAEAGADVVLADLTEFPAWLDDYLLESRLANLDARLQQLQSVAVAFSGGADSAFLLAAAVRVLGTARVVAATAVSSSLPDSELNGARAFAQGLGVRHVTPPTYEMERDGYRANAGDRCYFCKAELLDVLSPLAAELGVATVVTGTNADDARAGFRPGIKAAAQRGAMTPLLDAGLTKAQIRLASKRWGLTTWNKPAAACLSSRVAYGIEVTPRRLERVERAEVALRSLLVKRGLDVRDVRVRDLGDVASVELDAAFVESICGSGELEEAVVKAVTACGFPAAVIDSVGFRSGSMNELLVAPERYR